MSSGNGLSGLSDSQLRENDEFDVNKENSQEGDRKNAEHLQIDDCGQDEKQENSERSDRESGEIDNAFRFFSPSSIAIVGPTYSGLCLIFTLHNFFSLIYVFINFVL